MCLTESKACRTTESFITKLKFALCLKLGHLIGSFFSIKVIFAAFGVKSGLPTATKLYYPTLVGFFMPTEVG
ncbi:MAG: hypothetical protein A3A24_01725 [Candidatus Buchananbacteria bacterium RIFCSPLOWO2_01_FULL_46_12]|uniref:Uncharacterized protein n=2 Tax=Candidatus Buchananiibacteriota TaxID=1817903 RepID=A0A1G1YM97_9BACT|nr:MAG: hypothetical protein A2744_02940 [Candidatus Buchananbacteria bacterium RIFCSPHIGHO2_01_FULL_44_11]OGY53482.1 MAG: hypothetical protein A3A24_01725 [Candidatus Buchananbacteria bacterium RIFCSPLOWO2_01_FULL_46_12]